MLRGSTRPRHAFSLIELLVVCAILAVLAGMLMAGIQRVREAANRVVCANNLRQIGLAIHNFHDSTDGLPPSRIKEQYATWLVLIAPYLEGDKLYDQWDLSKSYAEQTTLAQATPLKVYYCPSRRSPANDPGGRAAAHTDYACNSGDREGYSGYLDDPTANGVMVRASNPVMKNGQLVDWTPTTTFSSVTDGLSNTLLVGEKEVKSDKFGVAPTDGPAYNGGGLPRSFARVGGPGFPLAKSSVGNITEDERVFGSAHPGICQFVMCDGHIVRLKTTLDPAILKLLTLRNDGKPVPAYD